MIIYEIVCDNYQNKYVLFRTKDKFKADAFCDVYNKYHNDIFDRGVKINTIDTNQIERHADKLISRFKFVNEVKINDGEIESIKPVYVDDNRIAANDFAQSLSEGTTLFFDITDDLTAEKIWAKFDEVTADV